MAATLTAPTRKPKRVREGAREPQWIQRELLEAIHDNQLREHGGLRGIRDEALLESALSRPRTKWVYGERDLSVLAAAYAFGVARKNAFIDGNKRSAFLAAALFLSLNGLELDAPEPEVVDVMTRLAAGKLSESAVAEWLRAHLTT
jgi:death-on-curing protein